jgi:hypothetical protein
MENLITVRKYYRGYLVRWPAEWVNWDHRTYREKYFDGSAHNQTALDLANLCRVDLLAEMRGQGLKEQVEA